MSHYLIPHRATKNAGKREETQARSKRQNKKTNSKQDKVEKGILGPAKTARKEKLVILNLAYDGHKGMVATTKL